MHKHVLTLVLVLCLLSCNEQKQESKNIITLKNITPTEEPVEGIPDNEVVKIVKLELTDASILSSISKLEITDSLIFAYDAMSPNIFVFSHEGKFLNQIGKRGEGPQEYINFNTFFVDKKNEEVIIVDDYKRVLLYYSYNGGFLRRVSLPEKAIRYCANAILLENDLVLQNNMINPQTNMAYNIIDLKQGDLKGSYFSYHPISIIDHLYPFSFHPMSKCSDGVSLIMPMNDTIYRYNAGEFEPKYMVEHSKKLPDAKDFTSNCSNLSMEYVRLWKEGFFTGFNEVFETDDKIVLPFRHGIQAGYYVGDKKTMSGIYYVSAYSLDTKILPLYKLVATHRDMFVGTSLPSDFMDLKHIENPLFKKLLEETSEDDNPCLFFYKLK